MRERRGGGRARAGFREPACSGRGHVAHAPLVLGIPLDLFPAIVIDSAAYAARAIIFFIPAGLAVQEGALVLACAAFGIGTVPALALALVLRLRDVICGLPLLYWPLLEYRHLARTKAGN